MKYTSEGFHAYLTGSDTQAAAMRQPVTSQLQHGLSNQATTSRVTVHLKHTVGQSSIMSGHRHRRQQGLKHTTVQRGLRFSRLDPT